MITPIKQQTASADERSRFGRCIRGPHPRYHFYIATVIWGWSHARAAMKWFELRIPPLLLMLAAGASMWLLQYTVLALRFVFTGQNVVAAALALIGLFFCSAGVLAFRRANTTVNPM